MKIGLLTYHSVCNFGANLQTLSTVSYFRNRNIEIKVIDWYPKSLKQFYEKIPLSQQLIHNDFVDSCLPTTKHCETSGDVKKIIQEEGFDKIIIGSDAVFSFIPLLRRIHPSRRTLIGITKVSDDHKVPNPFWADFSDTGTDLKIIAMSASAQYLDLSKCLFWEKQAISNSLRKFRLITVRDRWTKSIVSRFTQSPTITPDPVFAFNENTQIGDHEAEIKDKYSLPDKYVIFSFCSKIKEEAWFNELFNILKNNGYAVVNLAMPEGTINIKSDMTIDTPLSPIEWYDIIRYSNGYIGQRMHPMIVALYNKVPFVIFDHYAFKKGKEQLNSSKIYDLLERADLLGSYSTLSRKTSPEDIYMKLSGFDNQKAESFVQKYTDLYFEMMKEIEQL